MKVVAREKMNKETKHGQTGEKRRQTLDHGQTRKVEEDMEGGEK